MEKDGQLKEWQRLEWVMTTQKNNKQINNKKKNKDRQGKNDTRWCGEDKESNDTHKTINSENWQIDKMTKGVVEIKKGDFLTAPPSPPPWIC